MKKVLFFLFCLFLILSASGQKDSVRMKFAETITAAELKTHMMKIAGPEFEGRETGRKGQKLAADYLASQFQSFGIKPYNNSWFQQFPLNEESFDGVSITINSFPLTFLKDFYCWSSYKNNDIKSNEIVFAGFGISEPEKGYDDYAGLDVKGKIVLLLEDEPMDSKGNSFLTGTTELTDWTKKPRKKTDLAEKKGALAVLMVQKNFENDLKYVEHYLTKPRTYLKGSERKYGFPVMYIPTTVADNILKVYSKKLTIDKWKAGIRKKKSPNSFTIKCPVDIKIDKKSEQITGENVLAYIPGTDLKDELIVITAHYDHLGKQTDGIYYGADDDGSGTVALIELADAFMNAVKAGKGPRRSILIMPVSGEEKGLLGSEYYASNPVFPLSKTVVDLNIDMIGRVDDAYKGNPDYVYVIGSDKLSKDLKDISEKANAEYTGLKLDYKFDDPNDPNRFYYRSDHYNFAKNNIPVIFYFNGVHEDYHKITDTPDKINYDKIQKITRLVFFTAWELANRNDRIKLN